MEQNGDSFHHKERKEHTDKNQIQPRITFRHKTPYYGPKRKGKFKK
jgi:hypothetical protein